MRYLCRPSANKPKSVGLSRHPCFKPVLEGCEGPSLPEMLMRTVLSLYKDGRAAACSCTNIAAYKAAVAKAWYKPHSAPNWLSSFHQSRTPQRPANVIYTVSELSLRKGFLNDINLDTPSSHGAHRANCANHVITTPNEAEDWAAKSKRVTRGGSKGTIIALQRRTKA